MTQLPYFDPIPPDVTTFRSALRRIVCHMATASCEYKGWHIVKCLRADAFEPLPGGVVWSVIDELVMMGLAEARWDVCEGLCRPQNGWCLTDLGQQVAAKYAVQETPLAS